MLREARSCCRFPDASAEQPPNVSSLNFATADIANAVIAPISPSGVVCLRTRDGSSDLIADLVGWFPG